MFGWRSRTPVLCRRSTVALRLSTNGLWVKVNISRIGTEREQFDCRIVIFCRLFLSEGLLALETEGLFGLVWFFDGEMIGRAVVFSHPIDACSGVRAQLSNALQNVEYLAGRKAVLYRI